MPRATGLSLSLSPWWGSSCQRVNAAAGKALRHLQLYIQTSGMNVWAFGRMPSTPSAANILSSSTATLLLSPSLSARLGGTGEKMQSVFALPRSWFCRSLRLIKQISHSLTWNKQPLKTMQIRCWIWTTNFAWHPFSVWVEQPQEGETVPLCWWAPVESTESIFSGERKPSLFPPSSARVSTISLPEDSLGPER